MKASSILEPQQFGSWLHEAFLARAAEPGAEQGRHALGAFLTLRLADRFRPDEEPSHPLALAYQVRATRDYLLDLHPRNEEAVHLLEVVRLADAVQQGGKRSTLWPPLLAYAHWLEQELRLEEALDVVETALGLNDGGAPTEEIGALLQRGRILRHLGRFEEAKASYQAGRTKAAQMGDKHSELLGRIGHGIVTRQLGNLKKAEQLFRGIIGDAERLADPDAEARARHDLGVALTHQRRAREAIPELYRAFELYEQQENKLRALSDVGEAFKVLGAYAAAEDAFLLVLAAKISPQVRAATMEELLEVSALRGNRVAFANWRRKLDEMKDELPPHVLADTQLALGLGYQAFENRRKAECHLREAVRLAEAHALNEVLIRAEQALNNLSRSHAQERTSNDSHSWAQDGVVSEVAERLHALRSA